MKKRHQFLFAIMTLFFSLSYGQQPYSDQFINDCIREVYINQADALVFNPNSRRLELITDFFSRVEIVPKSISSNEKMINISNFKLNNKYNQNLQHEIVTDPYNFNPLKYRFQISATTEKKVRLNNDYIIIINPKK